MLPADARPHLIKKTPSKQDRKDRDLRIFSYRRTTKYPPTPNSIKVDRLALIRCIQALLTPDRTKLNDNFQAKLAKYKVEDNYASPKKPPPVPPIEKTQTGLLSYTAARAAVRREMMEHVRPAVEAARSLQPDQDILTGTIDTASRDRWGCSYLQDICKTFASTVSNSNAVPVSEFTTRHNDASLLKAIISLIRHTATCYNRIRANYIANRPQTSAKAQSAVPPMSKTSSLPISQVAHQLAVLNPVHGAFPSSIHPSAGHHDNRVQAILHHADVPLGMRMPMHRHDDLMGTNTNRYQRYNMYDPSAPQDNLYAAQVFRGPRDTSDYAHYPPLAGYPNHQYATSGYDSAVYDSVAASAYLPMDMLTYTSRTNYRSQTEADPCTPVVHEAQEHEFENSA